MTGIRAALSIVALCAVPTWGNDLRVELDEQQRATVVGAGPSVRQVVEELCYRAGAAFQYDEQEIPFAISVEREPLEVVLARLLSGRSYVLRLRRDGDGHSRVASLHVLGPDGAARRVVAAPTPQFVVPATMMEAAFRGGGSPEARAAAVQGLFENVRDDPERRRAFLETDPAVMLESLRGYPEALSVLRRMHDLSAGDAEAQAKLGTLMRALE
jgi:hypothetical protein